MNITRKGGFWKGSMTNKDKLNAFKGHANSNKNNSTRRKEAGDKMKSLLEIAESKTIEYMNNSNPITETDTKYNEIIKSLDKSHLDAEKSRAQAEDARTKAEDARIEAIKKKKELLKNMVRKIYYEYKKSNDSSFDVKNIKIFQNFYKGHSNSTQIPGLTASQSLVFLDKAFEEFENEYKTF